MKQIHKNLLVVAACLVAPLISMAQIGTWKAFMSYYEPQQIVKAGAEDLFVKASNSIYQYNLTDHSITTYDKMRQLSDTRVADMAWNQQAKRLIIVYDNSNIDLLDLSGNVVNISSIYTKSTTLEKNVNSIYIYDKFAYVATGFGVVKINMERAEIAETYILNKNVTNIGIDGDKIYVSTLNTYVVKPDVDNNSIAEGEVVRYDLTYDSNKKPISKTVYIKAEYTGLLTDNLIDSHNWQFTTSYPSNIFTVTSTDWDDYIETVRTLKPGGPKYNFFGFLRYKNNMLYTTGGTGGDYDQRPATVQLFDGNEWSFLQDDVKGVEGTESSTWMFVEMYSVDVDPRDSRHIFATGRTGVYEYYDGKLVKYYNKDISILQTATTSNRYVLALTSIYDDEGNFWIIQSSVTNNNIIEVTKDGEWISHFQNELMNNGKSLNGLRSLIIDSRGLMWFVNRHWDVSSFYCYNPKTNQIERYMTKLVNQDGVAAGEGYTPTCIVEDLEGNLWLGTNKGLYMIEASQATGSLDYATQVKVPRNDGTNYADYLMAGVNINCIAVDGANRKWIGTSDKGVYLISADNMEQIHHFTADSSPLLSDNVESIAINHETGEVFIGTDQGLCSYMSDATKAEVSMVKDNVYAYPNPVVSGYDGLITIVGLSLDADVKILSVSGQLVAQGRSNGGTFTWNGRDRQGRRVASGVYMVATATSNGEKGVVCKIAIVK